VELHKRTIFSRQDVIKTNTNITRFLGDFGYAFAQIDPRLKIDNKKHTVFVNFVLKPGKRVYVQRINFVGNTKTKDQVLRREMRQAEGGLFSGSNIDESKRRLDNLGYLKDVHPQLKPVEHSDDEVDLQYEVKEVSSAAASLQLGYSDTDGLIYGASLNERNFLGTGKSVGVQFDNSQYNNVYSFHYYDPYFTKNNIGFGVNLYYQDSTPDKIDYVSDYSMSVLGGMNTFSFPISDRSRLQFGYGYEHTDIKTYGDSPTQAKRFVNQYGHIFDNTKLTASWQYSNLDRAIFPTKGVSQSVSAEGGVPVFERNLEYYRLSYEASAYYPLLKHFVIKGHGYFGYGDGYGDMQRLPFFENYFAGGMGSIRGYEGNSLGPKDSNGDGIGGNMSVYATVGLVIPTPLDSMKVTTFFDAGNVFDYRADYPITWDNMRYSTGVQLDWYTPFAPLSFSLSMPIGKHPGDRTEPFQFQLGFSF